MLITNNNFTFSYYILIVKPSFSLVSAEFQPNLRRVNLANLLLKFDQNYVIPKFETDLASF